MDTDGTQAWRFVYRAAWLRSYDGDTPTMRLDLGLRTYTDIDVRIRDLWCPEVTGPTRIEGLVARDAAFKWFGDRTHQDHIDWPFLVELHKAPNDTEQRSFTRYIGDIYDTNMNSYAEYMVEHGYGTKERT